MVLESDASRMRKKKRERFKYSRAKWFKGCGSIDVSKCFFVKYIVSILPGIDFSVRTIMPSQSMLNSAEEITYLHQVGFNPLLIVRSALDLLHLTRRFQRN